MNNLIVDGTVMAISCPKCGPASRLVVRTRKDGKGQFLGCPNWPECDHTAEIPESIKMRAAGQRGLFDESYC